MSKAAFSPPIHDGRSDTIAAKANPGSYVMPADATSTLGRGSSAAGAKQLEAWERSHGIEPIGRVPMPKGKHPKMNLTKGAFAKGGAVDIKISPDEYMFHPDFPAKLGGGNHEAGIAKLNAVRARLHAHMAAGGMKGAFASGGPIGYDTGGVIGTIAGASAPSWDPSAVNATTGESASQTQQNTAQAQTLNATNSANQTSTGTTTNTGVTGTANNSQTASNSSDAYTGAFAPAATAVANQAGSIAADPNSKVNATMNPQVGNSISGIAGQTGAFSSQLQPSLNTTNALQSTDPGINANISKLGNTVTADKVAPTAFDPTKYENPFTSKVIDTTNTLAKQQNDQQLAQLQAQQAGSGAFGDQSGISRAILQGQQDLALQSTDANLEQANYTQAAGQSNTQQNLNLTADQANQSAGLTAAGLTQTGQQAAGSLAEAQKNQQLTAALGGNTITQAQYANLTNMLNTSGQLGLQQYQAALNGNQAALAWLNSAINGVSIGTKANQSTGATVGGSTATTSGTSTTEGQQHTTGASTQQQDTVGQQNTNYAQQNVGTTSGARPNEVGPGTPGAGSAAIGSVNTHGYAPAPSSSQTPAPSGVPSTSKEYSGNDGSKIWVSPDGTVYDNQGTPVPPTSPDYYYPPQADLPQGWVDPLPQVAPDPGVFTGGTGGVPYTDGNGNPSTDPGSSGGGGDTTGGGGVFDSGAPPVPYYDASQTAAFGGQILDRYAAGGPIGARPMAKVAGTQNPLHGDVTHIDRRMGFTPNHMGGAPAAAPHAMRHVNIPFKPPVGTHFADGGSIAAFGPASVNTGPGRIQRALQAFGMSHKSGYADGGAVSAKKAAALAAFLPPAALPSFMSDWAPSAPGAIAIPTAFGSEFSGFGGSPGGTTSPVTGYTGSGGGGVTSSPLIPGVTSGPLTPGVTSGPLTPGVTSGPLTPGVTSGPFIPGVRAGFARGGPIGYADGDMVLPMPIHNDQPEAVAAPGSPAAEAAAPAAFAPAPTGMSAQDFAAMADPDPLVRGGIQAKIVNSPLYQAHMRKLLGTTDKAVGGIGHGVGVLGDVADDPGIAYRGFGDEDKRSIASLVTPPEQMAALGSDPAFLDHQTAYALARSKNMSGGIVDFADRLQHAADQTTAAENQEAQARIMAANGQVSGGDTLLKAVPSAMTALPGLTVPGAGAAAALTPQQALELQMKKFEADAKHGKFPAGATVPPETALANDTGTHVGDDDKMLAAERATRDSLDAKAQDALFNGLRGINHVRDQKAFMQAAATAIDDHGNIVPSAVTKLSTAMGGQYGNDVAAVLRMISQDRLSSIGDIRTELGGSGRLAQNEFNATNGVNDATKTQNFEQIQRTIKNYITELAIRSQTLQKHEQQLEATKAAGKGRNEIDMGLVTRMHNAYGEAMGAIGAEPVSVQQAKTNIDRALDSKNNPNYDPKMAQQLRAAGEAYTKNPTPQGALKIDVYAHKLGIPNSNGTHQFYLMAGH